MSDPSTSDLLARLDERTQAIQSDLAEVRDQLRSEYVTQQEFAPIRAVVYGLVGTVMLAFLSAIVALVLRA